MLRTYRLTPYAYITPLLALLLLIFGYPIVRLFDFSMRRVRGASGPFIGLENYRQILKDSVFQAALSHNLQLLLAVPILIALALVIATLLYEQTRGSRFYRTALFMPYVLAIPVVGIVFSYMFQLNGVLNSFLRSLGLDALALDWLGNGRYALWTVMLVIVWREIGFGIIIFLARLMSLSEDLIDAALIDGANWWQRLWHVIIPELRGVIEFYAVVSTITMLAWVFSYIWAISKGGPGTATAVLELYIYNMGFRNALPGVASAVAVLLLLATLLLIGALFRSTWQAREEVG